MRKINIFYVLLTVMLAANAWAVAWTPSSVSYVVLNENSGGLVRVFPDGGISTINATVTGVSLWVEPTGNILVTTQGNGNSVLRVTPGGSVSTLATAPTTSYWMSVTEDAMGRIVTADNHKHAIWRMANDGSGATTFTNYSVLDPGALEDTTITVDGFGNYILAEDSDSTLAIYKISESGTVTPLTLTGASVHGATGVALDASGNYLVASYADSSIFTVTPAGAVSLWLHGSAFLSNVMGIARNPFSGEILATLPSGSFNRFSPDSLAYYPLSVTNPIAVGVDTSPLRGSGSVTPDPTGDTSGPPDIIEAAVIPAYPNLKIRVRFANFNASIDSATVYLDTDQNASTGYQGTGFAQDAGLIGIDYLVEFGAGYSGSAYIYQCSSSSCSATNTTPVTTLPDGFSTVIPLSLLGNSTGRVNFKAISQEYLGGGRYTGVVDEATDPGRAAASTQAPGATRNIGIYRASANTWYLDANGNGAFDSGDKTSAFGLAGATPVYGDWNGDGRTKTGFYINGLWYLDYDGNGIWDGGVNDKVYAFGWSNSCVVPVVGDWNGDGRSKIGVYCNGYWYLDYNGNGAWDGSGVDEYHVFGWAASGVTPIVGDWSGSGTTKIGIYYAGFWYLLNDDGVTYKSYNFGWNATGVTPVIGDWSGNGTTKIGIFYNGFWYLDVNDDGTFFTNFDHAYQLGAAGDTPVIGKW